jgi:CHAT domain-containing protein/Tfp pilus assembly protein PilF
MVQPFKTHKLRNLTSIVTVNLVIAFSAIATTRTSTDIAEVSAKLEQTASGESRQADVRELKMGQPIERELSNSTTHSYSVTLTQGQYLKVVVDQKGVDVVIRVFGPDGQKLRDVNETPAAVLESTFVIADAAGTYRIEVEASSKDAKSGTYEIRIKDLRESTSKDRIQVSAQKILDEANKLRDQQTAESKRKAVERYEAALPLWRDAGDRQTEANTLMEIGAIYSTLGENEKALDYFGRALPLYGAVENRQYEAVTLNNIGDVYLQKSETQKALEYYNRALPVSQGIKDRQTEATALGNIGRVYFVLGERRRAIEYFDRALLIRRELGDRWREAVALANLGATYDSLGEFRKTLEYYGQALATMRLSSNHAGEAAIINNMGLTYFKLGEFQKAVEHYDQALPITRATGDRLHEGYTLDNIGRVYEQMGEPQKALQYFNEALDVRRAIAHRIGQALTLTRIGTVYLSLGEPRKALEYFEQSLSLQRATSNRNGEAASLDSIGAAYFSLGELRKALDYHNQSLSIRKIVGDRLGEASTLANIGTVHRELGELPKALDYFDQALALRRTIGDRVGEADTLNYIGSVHDKLGDANKALEYFTQALSLSRAIGSRREEAGILLNVAQAERSRGRLVEARSHVESALNIIESTRSKVASPDLRTSYLASKQNYHEFHIGLLMQMHQSQPSVGYDATAFFASERGRARSLLELLAEARIDVKQGIAPDLKQREKNIQSRIAWTQNQLIQANSSAKPDPTKVAALEEAFKKLESERQQVEVEIRQKHPRYATLHYPSPLDLKAVQKLLDEKTMLLEYSLGQEASYLFAITHKEFFTARLPAASVITAQVNALREAVTVKPDRTALSNYFQRSRSLYRDLVQPAGRLLNGKRALIIVPDGILHYLPFEALLQTDSGPKSQPDLRQLPYMIRNYTISYAPSATVLASLRHDPATRTGGKTLLAFGDPAYEEKQSEDSDTVRSALDNAFGQSKPWELRQLPESRREVEGIAKLYSPSEVTIFLGEQAKEENVKVEVSPLSYRFVHFAVHGLLNENQPQYSGLVLSLPRSKKEKATGTDTSDENSGVGGATVVEDGLLQVYEILNLRLNADLVVLSACETGLGKATKGEGIVGMTQAFLYAGTPAVAVSLWKVQDRSTSDLMVRLYRHLKDPRLNKADALRQAQLEMIRNGDYSHPYYWAGFVMIGQP